MTPKSDLILVPLDPSGCAHEVAATVSDLAGRLGAQVVLLHVIELPAGLDPTTLIHPLDGLPDHETIPLALYLGEDAREQLKPLAQIFLDAGCSVQIMVRSGEPAPAILSAAADLHATMIAMGTHGRKGFRRWLEGSVAETVLRESHCPVLTVRTHAPEAHSGKSAAQLQAAAETSG